MIQNKVSKRPRMNLRKNNTGNGQEEVKGTKEVFGIYAYGLPK